MIAFFTTFPLAKPQHFFMFLTVPMFKQSNLFNVLLGVSNNLLQSFDSLLSAIRYRFSTHKALICHFAKEHHLELNSLHDAFNFFVLLDDAISKPIWV